MKKMNIFEKNIQKGSEINFFSNEAFIDIDYFMLNKIEDKKLIDIVIEIEALKENGQIECKLVTFVKIIQPLKILDSPNKKLNPTDFKTKSEIQKLFLHSKVFDIHDVYGLDSSLDSTSNDCELCFSKKKNTIFLPCRHSSYCRECITKIPERRCPMCRTTIVDCLILEDIKVKE